MGCAELVSCQRIPYRSFPHVHKDVYFSLNYYMVRCILLVWLAMDIKNNTTEQYDSVKHRLVILGLMLTLRPLKSDLQVGRVLGVTSI